MEIRDVIHGSIEIEPHEVSILDSRYFQRLRAIKQLGFSEYAYPSATHNRYTHSLGALFTATQAFETIFQRKELLDPATYYSFRAMVRLAAMLHDIGHGPLSHTSEMAMPPIENLKLTSFFKNSQFVKERQATHEDYTIKILLDSALTAHINKAGEAFGFTAHEVASLICPEVTHRSDFFNARLKNSHAGDSNEAVQFHPILRQIISSELDADRMDYLRRDSYYAGVTYGDYDYHWLARNLTFHIQQQSVHLAIDHRALYAFEDFLISRYHMFLMVYFHHKSVIYDEMLKEYFLSTENEYLIPGNPEEYLEYTDSHLMECLSKSSNPWAKRITEKRPYRLILETHSGLDELRFSKEERIEAVLNELTSKKVHSIQTTSTGQLSKYFGKPSLPLFVRYSDRYHPPEILEIHRCTDLFERYREKRSIRRIYAP